eukprot:TRINITY_DN16053_c1_g1_i1.p1 TRINITY_DN16053_c1_g1~~TRINITY_DN16053_c1_g1_i1.p1  ORF type:complete len:1165 (-),score=300.95 TRINITY_DN16053_c1_g1_i1:47-3541(-)
MSTTKKAKKKKEPKKEVKKDLTPQLVTRDLADNTYSGIIREDQLGLQFLEGPSATYQWASGAKYEGPFVASQIEGKGKFMWPDSSTYEGELLGGKRHGEGTYVGPDRTTRYEGQWNAGKRHGQGKLTYHSDTPSYYEGGWQAGQKHGQGKQLWPTGNEFEGQWQLGKMSGEGTMIWRNSTGGCERYSGQWVDSCPHGMGTHTWMVTDPTRKDDATAESWLLQPTPPGTAGHHSGQAHPLSGHPLAKHDSPGHRSTLPSQPQGHGRHDSHTAMQQLNNRYTGQWVWGRREGLGTFYYANGAYYHGEWKNHMKHGFGRHTFEDGKVYTGAFEADRMLNYSKPEPLTKAQAALEENPICSCTDISDLEIKLRPSDTSGFPVTTGAGYTDTTKILKGIYNTLLRNLGELREAYARSRGTLPLLGEDPHVMTTIQFWNLARDAGILTPACTIARIDRAIFSGPRHHEEASPVDKEDLRPLTPRPPDTNTQRKTITAVGGSLTSSKEEQAEESASQASSEESESDPPSPAEATLGVRDRLASGGLDDLAEPGDGQGAAAVGKKFVRSTAGGGNLASIHAPARPLLFRQFLEGLVRLSFTRFPNERGLEPQVQRLFKEQVLPSIKANAAAAKPDTGSLNGSVRPPSAPIFGVFTQPEVQDVVKEVEPLVWKIFVALSGDDAAQQAVTSVPGGGIFQGAGGLGAKACNLAEDVPAAVAEGAALPSEGAPAAPARVGKGSKDSPGDSETVDPKASDAPQQVAQEMEQEASDSAAPFKRHSRCIRYGDWGSPCRKLHVMARLNATLRVKDVLKLLDSIGLMRRLPPSKELQQIPLSEVLAGSTGDSISNLLCPLGTGLLAEELAEEDNQSEDEEGSGGSAAPEEDILEDKKLGGKALPGLAKLNFMPTGSLLGPQTGSLTSSKGDDKKKKAEKETTSKKGKEKEEKQEVVRTPADDLACINLMVDAMDVLRILAQTLSPSSLELLHWELEADLEGSLVDDRISILEFMEAELVFAEFMRFVFLLAELTTRRDSKFCRSTPMTTRLNLFIRSMVLAHLQSGSVYSPPEPLEVAPPRLGEKGAEAKDKAKPAAEAKAQTEAAEAAEAAETGSKNAEEGADATGEDKKEEEAQAPPPAPPSEPVHWLGFDDGDARLENLRVSRRWPAGYEQEVASWN